MSDPVSKQVCDERFDRIITAVEKMDSKIDKIGGDVSNLDKKFAVYMTNTELEIGRLKRIEDKKEADDVLEKRKLKEDREKEPERRKIDRRYIVGVAVTIVFSLSGLIIGIIKLVAG